MDKGILNISIIQQNIISIISLVHNYQLQK